MALPELLINSPTPGSRVSLTTLSAELKTTEKEMKWTIAPPTPLHGPGQFRVVIGSEIILCEAGSSTTVKILERAVEESVEGNHANGEAIWGLLTAKALETYYIANNQIKKETLSPNRLEKEQLTSEQIKERGIKATSLAINSKSPVALASTEFLEESPESESGGIIKSTTEANLVLDGKGVAAGYRVLIKNQVSTKEDGIYEVIKPGKAGEKWELKRTSDGNTTAELQNAMVVVEKGTINEGSIWQQTSTVTTVGTTGQKWESAIKPESIALFAVTEKKIAAEAISTAKIAKESVTEEKLATNAVTSAKINSAAVTAAKLNSNSVETGKIKNEAVTGEKIKVGTPEAPKELKENASVENTTASTTVYLSILLKAEKTAFEVIADGVAIYQFREETLVAASANCHLSFRIKAKAKWEVKTTVGKIESSSTAKSVYSVQEG